MRLLLLLIVLVSCTHYAPVETPVEEELPDPCNYGSWQDDRINLSPDYRSGACI